MNVMSSNSYSSKSRMVKGVPVNDVGLILVICLSLLSEYENSNEVRPMFLKPSIDVTPISPNIREVKSGISLIPLIPDSVYAVVNSFL